MNPFRQKQHAGRTSNGVEQTVHAFSIDLEPWFSAHNLNVPNERWDQLPLRIEEPVLRLLEMLERHGTRATFFVLGWLAERCPNLVREISQQGHEVASHGYGHRVLHELTPDEFVADVRRASQTLEQITGRRVVGYRAPSYSVNESTLWALVELEQLGFLYDSSVYPLVAPHGRYGFAGARRDPHPIRSGLWEFPMPTLRAFGKLFPVCTGGYLRHWPMWVTRWAMRQNARKGRTVVVNVHPWELDTGQPVISLPLHKRRLHYGALQKTEDRIEELLRMTQFAPLCDLLPARVLKTAGIPTDDVLPATAAHTDSLAARAGGQVDQSSM